MANYYGESVPTSLDAENRNLHKYTVNKNPPSGHILISKTLCALMALGVVVLLILTAVATFFLVPIIKAETEDVEGASDALSIKLDPVDELGTTRIENVAEIIHPRLPTSIQPKHYKLKIIPDFTTNNFSTSGEVTITLSVLDETRKIIFHANELDIERESLSIKNIKEEKKINIVQHEYNKSNQRYTITVGEDLVHGESYDVNIKFKGVLNDHMQGFYRSSYRASQNNDLRWIASTQFSPTDARRAFPCMDEPSLKAKFTISIARPSHMNTLSNMQLEESVPFKNKAKWFWDHYKETPPMSTYLVAFLVGDLQQFKTNSNTPQFTMWSRQDALNQTVFASVKGPEILHYFENYFGMKFPLPKIDMVAVPDFGFQAMENWGIITFRETALLYDPRVSTIDDKRFIELVIAHEIAHQWFGNLVTPKWWDDLWLKEGFASYLEYEAINYIEPTWDILDEFPLEDIQNAFAVDSLISSRPLSFPVQNSDQIRQTFDKISYSKGAAIIRMAKHALGENVFNKALIGYLEKHKFSNADRNDVWEALQQAGKWDYENTTVASIMESWVLQPGFPVITCQREQGLLKLQQNRFLQNGKDDQDTLWHIPLSLASDIDRDFTNTTPKIWMEKTQETSLELASSRWYLLNLQQTGYFIVNYDESNWRELMKEFNSFPPVIRGQLVSDSMLLAKAGLLDYSIPLNFVKIVGLYDKNVTLVPIKLALDHLEYLKVMLQNTPSYGQFEKYVKTTFDFAFNNIGLDDRPSNSYKQQRIRRTVLNWSLRFSDLSIVIKARSLFRQWMTNNLVIAPNLRDSVYCAAIRESDGMEWEFALQKYSTTTSAIEKKTLLEALACADKQWLLSKLLNMILDNHSGVRKQDSIILFNAVAQNPVGQQLAFDFLRTRWNDVKKYYGDGFNNIGRLIESFGNMNTLFQLTELKSFAAEHKSELGPAKQSLQRTIEKVSLNILWMQNNYENVSKWLENSLKHIEFLE